jgi:hypothetical protein
MKTRYLFAVALIATVAVLPFCSSYAQAPAGATLSPAAAEVVKLAGAGTGEEVVLAYVQNSQTPFDLTADQVLYLKDVGVPSSVVAAMLTHDSSLRAQAPPPAVEAPTPAAAPVPVADPTAPPMGTPAPVAMAAPPAAPVAAVAVSTPPPDVGYFYNDLAPYGTWVDLPGAGWCWQPTVCATVGGWQPYLHGGHWMNTDAGWFWASDYSWGWAPFHYGRWQMHPTAGWVWFPGRVWGPSWVVWRSGGDHCGWAPLPPRADFVAGVGWSYNGVHVAASFDFGLSVGCFSFVSLGHFGDHNLYSYCVPRTQVTQIYKNTTIINNVTYVNNTYVNRGVNVNVFERAGGHKFETVRVSESPHGGVGTGGAYRHPLPPPAPVHTMAATKVDARGRIPANLASNPRLTTTTAFGAGKPGAGGTGTAGNTGGQKGNPTLSNVKATGPTHNFSTDAAETKTRSGTSLSTNPKLTTTTSGNINPSGVTTGQKGNMNLSNTKATGGLPASSKLTTTTGSAATLGNKSNTAGGSTAPGSNAKLYNYQGTPTKAHTEFDASSKQVNPGDVRGANALTTRENKFNNASVSGSGQKTLSTGASGSSSVGGNANRLQSNPNLQRSGSTTKGSSSSGASKDPTSGGSSH